MPQSQRQANRPTHRSQAHRDRKSDRKPAWKQLHHWQGLGLVLLMLPLGVAVVAGSALLERANRQGVGTEFVTGLSNRARTAGRSLKHRQRQTIQAELKSFSSQLQEQLEQVGVANAAERPAAEEPAVQSSANSSAMIPDLSQVSASSPSYPQPSSTEVEEFIAIALGSEFSPVSQPNSIPHIRKWTQDLRIRVNGQPTAADLDMLEQVVAELNQLLSEAEPTGAVRLGFVDGRTSEANLDIFFVPEDDFSYYEPSYQPTNHGFFWSEADQGAIQRGRILISTTEVSQAERSHLIREELTQSLGLMQDSLTDTASIFYQGWSWTQTYSPQDRLLLKLLYRDDIRPGMDESAVRQVLSGR